MVSNLDLCNPNLVIFFLLREALYIIHKGIGPREEEYTDSNIWKSGPTGARMGTHSPRLFGEIFYCTLHSGATDFNPIFHNASSNILINALTIVMTTYYL